MLAPHGKRNLVASRKSFERLRAISITLKEVIVLTCRSALVCRGATEKRLATRTGRAQVSRKQRYGRRACLLRWAKSSSRAWVLRGTRTLVIVRFALPVDRPVISHYDIISGAAERLAWAGAGVEDLSFDLDVARKAKGG